MAAGQLTQVIGHLRSVLAHQDAAGLSDGDLVKRYVRQRDEAAFEALVRRHGPMIMGVCRRVLHNVEDAEDAFQATFLVLVRKASRLRSPGMVGNWLYGVAYRTALEARKLTAKRRAKEAKTMPRTQTVADTWTDLRAVLDQELERLPDKYRAVLVLCDLEGKTRKEAARHLGWPEGTVASRLATARKRLARRLAGKGLALSSAGLAAVLSQKASAGVPASVVTSTIKAANLVAAGQAATGGIISLKVAALTQGVMKAMLLAKIKTGSAVVFLATVIMGAAITGSGLLYQTQASEKPDGQKKTKPEVPAKVKDHQPPGEDKDFLQKLETEVERAETQVKIAEADLKRARARLDFFKKQASRRALAALQGSWQGEKNGIKVDLIFDQRKPWPAHWQVGFIKNRKPKRPNQSLQVNIGTDLKCLSDIKNGRLILWLPGYLGDIKEIKQIPGLLNGDSVVGVIQKGAEGSIQLRIIPPGREDPKKDVYDYPAVEGLVLRRVEPVQKGKEAELEPKPGERAWASKFFEETCKDFGNCKAGEQLKHRFKMTNIYKIPLEITKVRVSSGCLTYSLAKKILQPRETGYLEVAMDTTRFTGAKSLSIYVTVGPEYLSTATLTVRAKVLPAK